MKGTPQSLTSQQAQERMWAYLDGHVLRDLFADETRWKVFRAAQGRVIDGRDAQTWYCERLGRHVTDWGIRADLWERAVDLYAEDITRPDRRPNESARPISNTLRYVVIPREFDPFKQFVSSEPEPGTEHAAVGESVRQDKRSSGDQRVKHPHDGAGFAALDAVMPLSFPTAVIEGWAREHPAEAAEADAGALRAVGIDPGDVASGKAQRPATGGKGAQYRGERTTRLVDAMRATGFTVQPPQAAMQETEAR